MLNEEVATRFARSLRALVRIEEAVVLASSIGITLTMAVIVIGRYAPFRVPFGLEDISTLLGAWLYFTAVGLVTFHGIHISGGILPLIVKNPRTQNYVELAVAALCVIVSGYFCIQAFSYCHWTLTAGIVSRSLRIPAAYTSASLCVGGVLMTFHFLVRSMPLLSGMTTSQHQQERETNDAG